MLNVFTSVWWLSVGLGSGIGLLYGITSVAVNRYALRQDHHRFMLIAVGGMLARMLLALFLIALIVFLLPVDRVAFFTSFLGVFVLGIVVEVWSLHHRSSTVRKG